VFEDFTDTLPCYCFVGYDFSFVMIWVKQTRHLRRKFRISPGLADLNNTFNELTGLFKAYVINLNEFLNFSTIKGLI